MFSEELRNLRKEKNISQVELSRTLGMSQSAIGMYESGKREPNFKTLELIANYFNVNIDRLLEGEKKLTLIPLVNQENTDIPIFALQDIVGYEEISEQMAKQGEYFAIKIQDDSMSPRIIKNDIVIAKKQDFIENGDIAIILVSKNKTLIRKVIKSNDEINLLSFNPSCEMITYTNEEIEKLNIQIIGKIVELRAKF